MGISNPDVLNLWRRTLKKPSYLFWVLFRTHPMRPLGFWEWSLNTQLPHEILSRLVFCKLSFTSLQLPFRDSLSSISFSKFVLISVRSLHMSVKEGVLFPLLSDAIAAVWVVCFNFFVMDSWRTVKTCWTTYCNFFLFLLPDFVTLV